MLRRAFLTFLPALVALVFLCGTPGTSIGGPEASAATTSSSTSITTTSAARGSLTQDVADVAFNQQADEDDIPDDRIVRTVVTIVWPDSALQARILHASDRAGRSHPPCASRPRAPPTTA
jgi:ABC-type glycerol-3-phosphate transport system substrate-binding protein